MLKPFVLAGLVCAAPFGFSQTNLFRLPAADARRAPLILCDGIETESEGRYAVQLDGKYGYADTTGRIVIPAHGPFTFDAAGPFGANGLACIRIGWKHGYIDRAGTWIVPASLDFGSDFERRPLVLVCREDKWGALGPDGREVIPLTYRAVQLLHDMALGLRNESGWAVADLQGRALTPFHFASLGNELGFGAEGLLPVQQDGRWGFAELRTGRVVAAAAYDQVGRFAEGHAPVVLQGKIGYIDRTGRPITAFHFEQSDEFSEGLAAVRLDGRWGYIDTQGRFAIAPTYDAASKFDGGIASVQRGDETLTINARNEPTPSAPPRAHEAPPTPSPQLVEGPQDATVRLDHLNLGLALHWEGSGRASRVRVFRLDQPEQALVWDARLAAGKLSDGLFLIEGQLVLFEAQQEFALIDLGPQLAAALQDRAAKFATEPAPANNVNRRALIEALGAIAADMDRVDALARPLELMRFRFDAEASNPTEESANRIRDARDCIQATKALTAKIDRAFRENPVLNAEQRALLDSTRRKCAANLLRVLDLR